MEAACPIVLLPQSNFLHSEVEVWLTRALLCIQYNIETTQRGGTSTRNWLTVVQVHRHLTRCFCLGMAWWLVTDGCISACIDWKFQFAWIIGILATKWKDVVLWQGLLQDIFTVFFTILQTYSLIIHFKLFKRCGEMQKASQNQYSKGSKVRNFDEERIYLEYTVAIPCC